jgi:hypothetical protein
VRAVRCGAGPKCGRGESKCRGGSSVSQRAVVVVVVLPDLPRARGCCRRRCCRCWSWSWPVSVSEAVSAAVVGRCRGLSLLAVGGRCRCGGVEVGKQQIPLQAEAVWLGAGVTLHSLPPSSADTWTHALTAPWQPCTCQRWGGLGAVLAKPCIAHACIQHDALCIDLLMTLNYPYSSTSMTAGTEPAVAFPMPVNAACPTAALHL